MKRNLVILYISLLLIPVVINYGLLTWTAPGVSTEANPWLGFLGSFLGIIGAISIAVMNNNNQKNRDREQEIKSFRSYITMYDFKAGFDFKKIKTNEDSRLVTTKNYEELRTEHKSSSERTHYFKLSQFGGSEVILDCKINITYKNENGKELEKLRINLGSIEHGIEVFIPTITRYVESKKLARVVEPKKVVVEYMTLRNEKMKLVHEYNEEGTNAYLCVLKGKGNGEIAEYKLYDYISEDVEWDYINKLK